MTDDILTNDAIRKLTGYKQPKKQCAWLASAGIWFKEDRNGYPRTTWNHVNNPIALRMVPDVKTELNIPNFDAM